MTDAATEFGLSLSVADIFQYPVLSDMARVVARRVAARREPDPFSLIAIENFSFTSQLKFPLENCQDLFPVTDTQASCINAALMDCPEGCYYLHTDIPSELRLERLISICEELWNHFDILRMVFIKKDNRYLQAVTKGISAPVIVHRFVEDPMALSKQIFRERIKQPLDLGTLYCEFQIFHSGEKPTRLGIRVTHAHFDGVSHMLLQNCLSALLNENQLSRVSSMACYIQYVLSQEDAALAYWRSLLKDSKPLPIFENPKEEKNRIIMSSQTVAAPRKKIDFTQATLFTAACATALADVYQTSDVVLSLVVSGQMMLPPGLNNVTGPCLNIIPMRISVDAPKALEQTVAAVQQQRLDSMPFEGSTVSNILKHCTEWPMHLRKYTYTVMFDLAEVSDMDIGSVPGDSKCEGHRNVQLSLFGPQGPFEKEEGVLLLAMPVKEGWQILVCGNARFVDEKEVEEIRDHIISVLATM
ncbi:hypothetical protein BDV97DRAFT_298665 [Delphinella strobiligena]|nr:hypothetical protein BDV97DRAFT_298665 [Delphinella strobiligena]